MQFYSTMNLCASSLLQITVRSIVASKKVSCNLQRMHGGTHVAFIYLWACFSAN